MQPKRTVHKSLNAMQFSSKSSHTLWYQETSRKCGLSARAPLQLALPPVRVHGLPRRLPSPSHCPPLQVEDGIPAEASYPHTLLTVFVPLVALLPALTAGPLSQHQSACAQRPTSQPDPCPTLTRTAVQTARAQLLIPKRVCVMHRTDSRSPEYRV